MTAAPARRTQAERRSETIGRLVDATIDAIAEIGYHRTSLGEVCERSGVSRGGLFRHFDSRLDLVVAAAEEVARRHLAAFDVLRDNAEPSIEQIVRFARDRVRARDNAVWFELLVAARTDASLRERLAPTTRQFYEQIEDRALTTLPRTGVPDEYMRLVVTSLVHMLDGEAIIGATYPRPDLDEARLNAAVDVLSSLRRRTSEIA